MLFSGVGRTTSFQALLLTASSGNRTEGMKMGRWVDVKCAAEYFSIKPKTLYSLAARGLLPDGAVIRLGRSLRINPEKVEEVLLVSQDLREGGNGKRR